MVLKPSNGYQPTLPGTLVLLAEVIILTPNGFWHIGRPHNCLYRLTQYRQEPLLQYFLATPEVRQLI